MKRQGVRVRRTKLEREQTAAFDAFIQTITSASNKLEKAIGYTPTCIEAFKTGGMWTATVRYSLAFPPYVEKY